MLFQMKIMIFVLNNLMILKTIGRKPDQLEENLIINFGKHLIKVQIDFLMLKKKLLMVS